MPKSPKLVVPTKEVGQISQQVPSFFYRLVPQFSTPEWAIAEKWRELVRQQPIATICRETLISYLLSLDWKITPRDSEQRDELKTEIQYYTKLFSDNNGLDFSIHLEWITADLLDIPFGGASEIGRENDTPEGKIAWILPLDGATLFPTANKDFPVGQKVDGSYVQPVYFPSHAINRVYQAPRRDIRRQGWGMAPPEKIYLALEMLKRGDSYYANLLLDTPEAGILDLGDMEKESAIQWVDSFRSLLTGVDAFKIPVLYEHGTKAEFIPFGQPPTTLMFDKMTLKFAAIIAAGYGLSLSDIGLSSSTNGGDTLAGTIRQERRSRKTGIALLKGKLKLYFDRMLPPNLEFNFIDLDDEVSVALGRARMANATAFTALRNAGMISPAEARQQMIADGLFTISMPEDPPPDAEPLMQNQFLQGGGGADPRKSPVRPGAIGDPKPPSQGGQGEVRNSLIERSEAFEMAIKPSLEKIVEQATPLRIRKLAKVAAKSYVTQKSSGLVELSDDTVYSTLDATLEGDRWWDVEFNQDEIVAALTAAYLSEIRRSVNELVEQLYEDGYLPSSEVDGLVFRLENELSKDYINKRSLEMLSQISGGSKYYIERIVASAVRKALTDIEKNDETLDIDTILSDNSFMQEILLSVGIALNEMSEYRLKSITSNEMVGIINKAKLDTYRRSGLSEKKWVHTGADEPCEYCKWNIEQGSVPLDFQYRSTFGETESGPAHPHEHCGVTYNRRDLLQAFSLNRFRLWTGD